LFWTTSLPGVTGTPALRMVCRATFLSPIMRMFSAEGPMKTMLQFLQISAKCAFSERKP